MQTVGRFSEHLRSQRIGKFGRETFGEYIVIQARLKISQRPRKLRFTELIDLIGIDGRARSVGGSKQFGQPVFLGFQFCRKAKDDALFLFCQVRLLVDILDALDVSH